MHCAPTGHAPRSVSVPMILRSRYCWGTAAIEIKGIAHRSGVRVGDGFALFPPAFPRSSALSGRKPVLQFFRVKVRYSAAVSLLEDLYCFVPSGSRVAEATHALWSFSVHFMIFSLQTMFTCLGVWLHLILKNELCILSDYEKLDIYYIYIYIYIYIIVRKIYNSIIYMVYRSFLRHFSSESTMFTSLPPRRLRWSAGVAGRSSSNRVPAPHSGMSLLVLPKGVKGSPKALPGQRQICGSSFSKIK